MITAEARAAAMEIAREKGTVDNQILTLDLIREVGTLDGGALQRWTVRVPLLPRHQYLIPGARRNKKQYGDRGADQWVGEYSAGIRAEGYDKLNKVAGIRFFTPETVHDRAGNEVANPIHSRDYLYHREIGQGYSETGQMILYVEDIEIDFQQAWEAERLKKLGFLTKPKKSKSSHGNQESGGWEEEQEAAEAAAPVVVAASVAPEELILRDENGMPKMGPRGELLFRLPQDKEVEAMQRLITLRGFGGRQARTICRRRILQQAFALRTLWTVEAAERPELTTQWVWVTGWRDQLTSDQALEKAREEAKQVFGAPIGTYKTEVVDDRELVESEEIVEADAREVDMETGEIKPVVVAPVTDAGRAAVSQQAAAGVIPGVTRGMPGERLAKAVCGDRDKVGPNPCTKAPGHCSDPQGGPHHSEDGVWPCEPEDMVAK